ncbi:hypothetical protein COOONC_25733 [Cooperia oncophora]
MKETFKKTSIEKDVAVQTLQTGAMEELNRIGTRFPVIDSEFCILSQELEFSSVLSWSYSLFGRFGWLLLCMNMATFLSTPRVCKKVEYLSLVLSLHMRWPALFAEFNMSLSGSYITFLPPIILKTSVNASDPFLYPKSSKRDAHSKQTPHQLESDSRSALK